MAGAVSPRNAHAANKTANRMTLICPLLCLFFRAPKVSRSLRNGYGMIVMGVNSRAGEGLFFGNRAAAVFREWPNPLLLVASGA